MSVPPRVTPPEPSARRGSRMNVVAMLVALAVLIAVVMILVL